MGLKRSMHGARLFLLLASLLLLLARAAWAAPELGTYQGAGCVGRDRIAAHEKWLGRKVDRVLDGPALDSWSAVVGTTRWITECWRNAGKALTFNVPMMVRDGSTSLADGARGVNDAHFTEIARILVGNGFGSAVIRISPEFNASWFQWTSLKDPTSWKLYWRRIVVAMRAVPGASFRFDWNPILGSGMQSPEPAYPGDDVVDLIGGDVYNGNWNPEATPEQRWSGLRYAPFGLEWHRRFAAAHGKPMSYPEWGTGTRPDGHGGGDDPVFMRGMANWITTNPVAYHIYWDYTAPDYDGRLSDGRQPLAAAVFLSVFGGPAR